MGKPNDFFVGVTDLFSVLLPGAVTAFFLMRAEESLGWDLFRLLSLSGVSGYAAFVLCAYLLGNVTDMIGASLVDSLYDLTYADLKRSNKPLLQWLWLLPARSFERLHRKAVSLGVSREQSSSNPQDTLFKAASRLARRKPKGDRLYQWCVDWIAVNSPSALTEVERLQANSKFFRNLVVVAPLVAAILMGSRSTADAVTSAAMNIPEGPTGLKVYQATLMGCLVLTVFSFFRFCDLRWKAVSHAYRLFVIIRLGDDSKSDSTPPDAMNES